VKPLLIVIAFLILTSTAKADLTSGELKTDCEEAARIFADQSAAGTLGSGICLGFVQGFAETVNLRIRNYIGADGRVFALSMHSHVSNGQMALVYLKWIAKHPEAEKRPAIHSLELALLASKLATLEMVGTFQPTPST
jgi:uncharacterized membrane protein (Fun14 family)